MIVDEKEFCFGCERSGSRLFFDKRRITLMMIYQDDFGLEPGLENRSKQRGR